MKAATLRQAEKLVDASGVAEFIEERLDAQARRPGRPRSVSVRAVLVGLTALFIDDRDKYISNLWDLLANELPAAIRRRLGCDGVTARQVYYLVSKIADCVNPSNDYRHDGRTLTETEQAEHADALQEVLNCLVDATLPADYQHQGSYAVDATRFASFAAPRSKAVTSPDPDATWSTTKNAAGKEEHVYGYALHAAVWVGEDGSTGDVPLMAERITVTDAAGGYAHPEAEAVKMMTNLNNLGRPLGDLIADRAYPHKKATSFHLPLRELGMNLVFDLHHNDAGPNGTHQGAVVADGWLYCPHLPQDLHRLSRPGPSAANEDRQAFDKSVEQPEAFALKAHSQADADGYFRAQCPAQAGKVRCPLIAASATLPPDRPDVVGTPPTATEPCCTKTAITIDASVLSKTQQKHRWGTPKWAKSYARRSRVEGFFGTLKDDSGQGARRGRFRLMGIARTSLFLGLFVAATNLAMAETWHRHKDNDTGPASGSETKKRSGGYRRKTIGKLIAAGTEP